MNPSISRKLYSFIGLTILVSVWALYSAQYPVTPAEVPHTAAIAQKNNYPASGETVFPGASFTTYVRDDAMYNRTWDSTAHCDISKTSGTSWVFNASAATGAYPGTISFENDAVGEGNGMNNVPGFTRCFSGGTMSWGIVASLAGHTKVAHWKTNSVTTINWYQNWGTTHAKGTVNFWTYLINYPWYMGVSSSTASLTMWEHPIFELSVEGPLFGYYYTSSDSTTYLCPCAPYSWYYISVSWDNTVHRVNVTINDVPQLVNAETSDLSSGDPVCFCIETSTTTNVYLDAIDYSWSSATPDIPDGASYMLLSVATDWFTFPEDGLYTYQWTAFAGSTAYICPSTSFNLVGSVLTRNLPIIIPIAAVAIVIAVVAFYKTRRKSTSKPRAPSGGYFRKRWFQCIGKPKKEQSLVQARSDSARTSITVLSPPPSNIPPVASAAVVGPQPVEILRQFEYISGKVRIKVKVVNHGHVGLLRVTFLLEIPTSFKFLRVEPTEYTLDREAVKLHELLPGEEKTVAWILEPLICGKEQVSGTLSWMSATGKPHALPMNPLEVEVHCPLFVQPEEANLPAVQRILTDLPVKSERVFFLPENLSPADALEVAKNAVSNRDVRFIGMYQGPDATKFDQSAWFYGVTKVGKKRYVLTASVSEEDHAIRVFTACDDEVGCTGFLAEAGATIRRDLVRRGAVDSETGVVELVCEKCGATLPKAPIAGRDVQCPECQWLWRFADFFH